MKRLPFVEPEEIIASLKWTTEVLSAGGVVVVPTESFYGLAADPLNAEAVEKVHALKGRPSGLGLPVLCADWQQLEDLVFVPDRFRPKLSRIWPAAVTVILPVRKPVPAATAETLAVRIPGHSGLRALLYRSGPVTGTSANRHKMPPCISLDDTIRSLVSEPDLALDAGRTAGGEPSTIVDLTAQTARIVRTGRVAWDDPDLEC